MRKSPIPSQNTWSSGRTRAAASRPSSGSTVTIIGRALQLLGDRGGRIARLRVAVLRAAAPASTTSRSTPPAPCSRGSTPSATTSFRSISPATARGSSREGGRGARRRLSGPARAVRRGRRRAGLARACRRRLRRRRRHCLGARMDKDLFKSVMRDKDIPVARSLTRPTGDRGGRARSATRASSSRRGSARASASAIVQSEEDLRRRGRARVRPRREDPRRGVP